MNKVNNNNIYVLNNIVRFNTHNRALNETVAAHSFYVAWFVLDICKIYHISDYIKSVALEAAIMHDIPEVLINDVTHDAKELLKGLRELMQPYEEEIIGEHSEHSVRILFKPTTIVDHIAKAIVDLADVRSVQLYVANEISMGNKTYHIIESEADNRAQKIENNLKSLLEGYEGGLKNAKK